MNMLILLISFLIILCIFFTKKRYYSQETYVSANTELQIVGESSFVKMENFFKSQVVNFSTLTQANFQELLNEINAEVYTIITCTESSSTTLTDVAIQDQASGLIVIYKIITLQNSKIVFQRDDYKGIIDTKPYDPLKLNYFRILNKFHIFDPFKTDSNIYVTSAEMALYKIQNNIT